MNHIKLSPPLTSVRLTVLLLAILAGLICSPHHVAAIRPQPRRMTAVIQAIDYKNKTITFQPDSRGNSLSIGWTWQTSFYVGDKRVKADSFKAGMQVKVEYLSPFLGREYAVKIEADSAAGSPHS